VSFRFSTLELSVATHSSNSLRKKASSVKAGGVLRLSGGIAYLLPTYSHIQELTQCHFPPILSDGVN
jgi:hypothetical protein